MASFFPQRARAVARELESAAPQGFSTSFWAEPWVSSTVLDIHLDPDEEEGSRRPERIAREAAAAVDAFESHGAKPGDLILDLGCGPGLYAAHFLARGFRVEGRDISPAAIRHARRTLGGASARGGRSGPSARFYRRDFTRSRLPPAAGAAMIYGIFGNLDEDERDRTLAALARALPAGAAFVFDCFTEDYARESIMPRDWYAREGDGFWRGGPHLVCERGTVFEEARTVVNSYHIVDLGFPFRGRIKTCHVRHRWYDRAELETLLARAGFDLETMDAGLDGSEDPAKWMGVVARRI